MNNNNNNNMNNNNMGNVNNINNNNHNKNNINKDNKDNYHNYIDVNINKRNDEKSPCGVNKIKLNQHHKIGQRKDKSIH